MEAGIHVPWKICNYAQENSLLAIARNQQEERAS